MKFSSNINLISLLVLLSIIVGLFLPSSIKTGSLRFMEVIGQIFALGFYLIAFRLNGDKINSHRLTISFLIVFTLIMFTFSGIFITTGFSIGAFIPYLIFALLLPSSWTEKTINLPMSGILLLIDIIMITLSIMLIINDQPVKDYFLNNYASGYDDLLPSMLARSKPVIFFATHSVAGFYFFLFFFLNFETYQRKGKVIFLIAALCYLILMIMLRSNTSFAFLGLGLMYLVVSTAKNMRVFLTIFAVLTVIIIIGFRYLTENFINIDAEMLGEALFSEGNGVSGRYSDNAGLSATINFIKDHPFQPIGLSFQDSLYATDSGPIVSYLRGGIILVILMYLGLYSFMKANLYNRKYLLILFGSYLLFELGYPNILIFRTQMLLPFILVYLNYLEEKPYVESARIYPG